MITAAILGLIFLWYERSWREKLLLAWIIVPVAFFQLWPVKGYQYLLPIAPPLALLAGRALGRFLLQAKDDRSTFTFTNLVYQPAFNWLMVSAVVLSLGWSSWKQIQPDISTQFLAGTGGVPGGREAGSWIQANVPAKARFLAIGPSMANIIQFYGRAAHPGCRSVRTRSTATLPMTRLTTRIWEYAAQLSNTWCGIHFQRLAHPIFQTNCWVTYKNITGAPSTQKIS